MSNEKVKSLFHISLCAFLIYIFHMVNTGFVFADEEFIVTIDRVWMSDMAGAEKAEFRPGEEAQAHVDLKFDTDEDTIVIVIGRIKGEKRGRLEGVKRKWRTRLPRQKDVRSPGENTASWDFTVNSDAIIGSEAFVSVIVNPRGGRGAVGHTTFNIVSEITTTTTTTSTTTTTIPQVTQLVETSPADGEDGVAISRETILRFSSSLNASFINNNAIFAEFGEMRLQARLHVSPDRKTVTLFYTGELQASARVRVTVNGDKLQDEAGRPVDADGNGVAGGMALIDFDTITLTTLPGTAVAGRVFDSEMAPADSNMSANVPLQGVTITVDSIEDTLQAVTDEFGNFRLEPAPVGRFFVHIDGRTATIEVPEGAFYPFLGKAWESVAGQETNVGDIFLPLIVPETLQPVSMTEETKIIFPQEILDEFPEFEGVSITVPADALFADDGTRGGMVGIAPVPPDRLPAPLPEGLDFPVVITVQTDGPTNFDQPIPVCFPNLPDPTTGQVLPAGSGSALWSFNHDTGRFEIAGPMTVTEDGKFVCTDPVVGILAPGWHGSRPGSDGSGGGAGGGRFGGGGSGVGGGGDGDDMCDAALKSCAGECLLAEVGLDPDLENQASDFVMTLAETLVDFPDLGAGGLESSTCISKCLDEFLDCQASRSFRSNVFPDQAALAADSDRFFAAQNAFVENRTPLNGAVFGSPKRNRVDMSEVQTELTFFQAASITPDVVEALVELSQTIDRFMEFGDLVESPLFYRVTDMASDFVLRGRLGNQGTFSNIILPPDTFISVDYVNPSTLQMAATFFRSGPNGSTVQISRSFFVDPDPTDTEADGLPDAVEPIIGTDPSMADTDGDGVLDGAELLQGSNPLDGLVASTGIIATADTLGEAIDICIDDDVDAVADSGAGVSVFNVFNGMNPTIIAQVDTPGRAQAVACAGNLISVADGIEGLAIIDISDPPAARIIHQIDLGPATSVAAVDGIAYVGLASGQIATVDLASGAVLAITATSGPVADLSISQDILVTLESNRICTFSIEGIFPQPLGFMDHGRRLSDFVPSRIFNASPVVYMTHFEGFDTIDISDPADPKQLGRSTQFFGTYHGIAPNGSGMVLTSLSRTSNDAPVALFDGSDPTNTDKILTEFETPGFAAGISIFNGLAYVADGDAGMQVISYLPFDSLGIPPTITLSTNFSPGGVEAGKPVLVVTADVSDDVQVRNVEFFVDGDKVASDGTFPFELRFFTPQLGDQSTFTLGARALDTGGNVTSSDEIVVTLISAPPRILSVSPPDRALVGDVNLITVFFSKPIDPTTLTAESFTLQDAGTDDIFDTTDDVTVANGTIDTIELRGVVMGISMQFTDELPSGLYRAVVSPSITDLDGDSIGAEFVWTFRVVTRVEVDFHESFVVGDSPSSVVVNDFNGDSILDVATANSASDDVSILLGDGTGAFTDRKDITVGDRPESVAVGDFNGDGILDLTTANSSSEDVSILLGDGNGAFAGPTNFELMDIPTSIAVSDFNGDGILDLVAAERTTHGDVSILLGDGTGAFSDPNNFRISPIISLPEDVAVGDFNEDGLLDLVTAQFRGIFDLIGEISILLGDGTGSFSEPTILPVGEDGAVARSVAVSDFNEDGNLDLAVAVSAFNDNVSIFLGDGTGAFLGPTRFAVGSSPESIDVGDFNQDGFIDIVTANLVGDDISILLGDGNGGFIGRSDFFIVGEDPESIAVGDFNGDGVLDIVTANFRSNDISILLVKKK